MSEEIILGKSSKKDLKIPLEVLKKHLIALGGSGSGKTVLSKGIIEEAARQGIPSILIDPQGDLASLALEGDDKTFHDNVEVKVYTPLSSKGIPISLNPFSFKGGEDMVPLMSEMSSSIAKLLGYSMTNDKGKAASAIIYTILSHSKNKLSFSILRDKVEKLKENIPSEINALIKNEKDLDELIRKISYMTVGQKAMLFSYGESLDIDKLFGKGETKTRISVIYLNTLPSQEDKEFFLSVIASKLYQWMLQNPSPKLQGIFYVDEVAPFIPAGSEKPLPKPLLLLLFKQARKYGISLIAATQNPGDIDYKAFSQFSTWAVGRLTLKQDQKKVENALKSIGGINIATELPSLKVGNFLLFSPDISPDIIKLKARWLYTNHKTLTEEDIAKLNQKHDYKLPKVQNNITNDGVRGEDKIAGNVIEEELIASSNSQKKTSTSKSSIWQYPQNIDEKNLPELIKKMQGKFLFWPKEKLTDYKLIYYPIGIFDIGCPLPLMKRPINDLKKKEEEHKVCINMITGSILNASYEPLRGTKELYNLTTLQMKVIHHLSNLKKKHTSAEIALGINSTKGTVTKALGYLEDKGLVQRPKELWESSLSVIKLKKIKPKYSPIQPEEKPNLKKPKITFEAGRKILKEWFRCRVISKEIVALPIYELIFTGKKGQRKVLFNATTQKIIKN